MTGGTGVGGFVGLVWESRGDGVESSVRMCVGSVTEGGCWGDAGSVSLFNSTRSTGRKVDRGDVCVGVDVHGLRPSYAYTLMVVDAARLTCPYAPMSVAASGRRTRFGR